MELPNFAGFQAPHRNSTHKSQRGEMSSLSAQLLKKVDPRRYFEEFLVDGLYPDGRAVGEHRPFRLDLGVEKQACGSSLVQQSGACVSCAVGLSVAPQSDEPAVLFELEATEGVSLESVEEAETTLDRILKANNLIEPDSLQVGKKADGDAMAFDLRWTLHLRIVVIFADGPVTGAVLSAVQSAILDTQLPGVEYTGEAMLEDYYRDIPLPFNADKVRMWRTSDGEKLPSTACPPRRVELKDHVQSMTFLLHNENDARKECTILVDPAADLLRLLPNRCEVVMGMGGVLHGLTINSALPIDNKLVQRIVRLAEERHAKLHAAMEDCLRTRRKADTSA